MVSPGELDDNGVSFHRFPGTEHFIAWCSQNAVFHTIFCQINTLGIKADNEPLNLYNFDKIDNMNP